MAALCGCACLHFGASPFFEAIRQGNAARVTQLLDQDITLLREFESTKQRRTAFHVAAEAGHIDVLKALAESVLGSGPATARLSSTMRWGGLSMGWVLPSCML